MQRLKPGAIEQEPPRGGQLLLCFAALHAVLFLYLFKQPLFYYQTGSDTFKVFWPAAQRLLAGQIPYRDFFVEYPPLGTAVAVLPALLHPANLRVFDWLFAAEMLLVDLAALLLIARLAARLRLPATGPLLIYGLGLPLLGAVVCQRYDLAPAALTLAALLALLERRSALAWLLLLLATLLKLYPLALAPLFVLYDWPAGRRAGAALYAGGLAASGAAWYALSPGSLARFVAWQTRRGIEIESLPGSAIQVLHGLGLPVRLVPPSVYGSVDLASSLTPALESLSTALTVIVLVAVYGAFALSSRGSLPRRRRTWEAAWHGECGDQARDRALVTCAALAVLGLLLCSKLLSIQFLIWVLPLLALHRPWRRRVAVTTISAVILSQWLYPSHWNNLQSFDPLAVAVLLVRNLLLLWLFVELCRGLVPTARPLRAWQGQEPAPGR